MGISKWNRIPLRQLCFRIGDGLHGTPVYTEGADIYFINGNNLEHGQIVITENTKTVAQDQLDDNYIELNRNSLLLSINGTLGEMAFYRNEKVMLGKSAAYLNFKTNINRFYYYYFQLKDVQQYFYNVATGSTIKNLSLKSIQDFEVPVPEENEWKAVAKVLSDLDSKIELNNKINAELEAMSKLIYDYWFVQFDFPDKNGKPYKSSGGKMVYNKELKREIPEGWEVENILSLANLEGGGTPSKKIDEYWNGDIPFFTPSDADNSVFKLRTEDYITEHGLKNSSTKLFSKGTLLITARGTVGNIMIASRDMAMNQSCYAFVPKADVNYPYLYFSAKSMVNYLKAKSSGSVFRSIVGNDIRLTPLVIPSAEIIESFGKLAIELFERILVSTEENQKLSELRDWLLPMLMNGQVMVGEVKEELSMAAEGKTTYLHGNRKR